MSEQVQSIGWAEFLQSQPHNAEARIREEDLEYASALTHAKRATGKRTSEREFDHWYFRGSAVRRHCRNCKQPQIMDCMGEIGVPYMPLGVSFADESVSLDFVCRNCRVRAKHIAVYLRAARKQERKPPGHSVPMVWATKFGERPSLAQEMPWPQEFFERLSEAERALLIKGRGCETVGAGIGAMAYYRRALDNSAKLLIHEIIRAAEGLALPSEDLDRLRREASNWQFDSSIKAVEPYIPQAVFYRGHNPIRLLYSQISRDLHAGSDSECLERAKSLRDILCWLLNALDNARRSQDEIGAKLNKLFPPAGDQ